MVWLPASAGSSVRLESEVKVPGKITKPARSTHVKNEA